MINLKKRLNLNLKPDPIDTRDYDFKNLPAKAALTKIPKSVDLRQKFNKARDQESLGACSSFAFGAAAEFIYHKRTKYAWQVNLSPLDLYYHERELMGTTDRDSGAYLRDGCKVLKDRGIAMEWFWPYKIEKFTHKPGIGADLTAGVFKVNSYWRAYSLQEIKEAISLEKPVVIGAQLFDNISSSWLDGKISVPLETSKYIGSHAMLVVGYNDNTQQLIIRNSWGSWGDEGYGYIPYDYFPHVHDIWVLI